MLRLAGLALALLLSLALAPMAWAHGGGVPRIVDQPAGPYRIFVWTSPDPLRVGRAHITVALMDPANNQPVLDADVRVMLAPVASSATAAPVAGQATHRGALIQAYYEVDLPVADTGQWRATIDFQKGGQSGSAAFAVEIAPAQQRNWLWIGLAALVITVVAWFGLSSRRTRQPVSSAAAGRTASRWQPVD